MVRSTWCLLALGALAPMCKPKSDAGSPDAAPSTARAPSASPSSSAPPPEASASRPSLPQDVTWVNVHPLIDSRPPTPITKHGSVTLLASSPVALTAGGVTRTAAYAIAKNLSGETVIVRAPFGKAPADLALAGTLDFGSTQIVELVMTDAYVYFLDEPVGYTPTGRATAQPQGRLVRVPLAGGRVELLAKDLTDPCGLAADAAGAVWRESASRRWDELTKTWLKVTGGVRAIGAADGKRASLFDGDVECPIAVDAANVFFFSRRPDGFALSRVGRTGGAVAYGPNDPSRLDREVANLGRAIDVATGVDAAVDAPGPSKPYDAIFDLASQDGKLSYIGKWRGKGGAFVAQAAVRTPFEDPGKPIDNVGMAMAMAADGANVDVMELAVSAVPPVGRLLRASRGDKSKDPKPTVLVDDAKLFGVGERFADVVKITAIGGPPGVVVWSDTSTQRRGAALWMYRP